MRFLSKPVVSFESENESGSRCPQRRPGWSSSRVEIAAWRAAPTFKIFVRPGVAAGCLGGFLALLLSWIIVFGGRTATAPKTSALPADSRLRLRHSTLPLTFEANEGQAEARVRFLSRGRGYALLLTDTEAFLKLSTAAEPRMQRAGRPSTAQSSGDSRGAASTVRLKLHGANPHPQVRGTDPMPAKSHYFLGRDPQKWKTGVSHYSKVHYQGVYPGIDLVYYGNQGQLEYDYLVAAGANPDSITFQFQGIEDLAIDAKGDLVIASEAGQLRLNRPRSYQVVNGAPRAVASSYRMKGERQVGFELAAFDPELPLVIDPVLSYSTYLGGNEDDSGLGLAADTDGNAYVTGVTQSATFPGTSPGQGSGSGGDVFVTKLNASGNALIYSVYLGGSGAEIGHDLAIDATGNVYVSGGTRSSNFPITPGAFQTTLRGASDAFVVKLNPAGSQLLYSSYLGGTRDEGWEGGGIAVDAAGQVYVTGTTDSLDFPTSRFTFQRSYGGGSSDAFITKFNASGSSLIYSTYLGGFDLDQGQGIAVDSGGRASVTGRTRSPNFVLHNAFQPFRRSSLDDAFVTRLNLGGDLVTYSTFVGGSGNDAGYAIAVDGSGNAYVAGETDSSDFSTTSNALMQTHGGGLDGFVLKVRTTAFRADSLVYATYLGGSGNDVIRGIATGSPETIYVTGTTDSTDFPSLNPAQTAFGGGASDAFAAKLDSPGTSLIYATYLGGDGFDSGEAVARGPQGSVFVAGVTESTNFPTVAAFQFQPAGKRDLFVSRIPAGDGSPAALVVTAGITLDPSASPHQVAQKLTAQFTLTNRGGSSAVLKELTLVESDPANEVPDFLPLRNVVIEPGDSLRFARPLTLTQTGTFHFQVAYQTPDGVWHDASAEEGSSSQLDITVENSSSTAAPVNSISASANPCEIPFGKNTCTIDLTWNTVNVEAAQVWVEDIGIGTPPAPFAAGLSETVAIGWIQGAPHKYKFTLYDVSLASPRELYNLEVTGQEGNPPLSRGTLQISDNPCLIPAGGTTCTTTITWTTAADAVNAILYVQDVAAGHSPSAVEQGGSGSVEVNWIQGPPHRYVFTLFEITATGQTPIAAVEVTGKEETKPSNRSGSISASANPCLIPAGGTTCSTVINWSTTADVSDARVTVTDVGASGSPRFFAKGKSGSVTIDTIEASPHRYVFTLYQVISNRFVELASVEVTGTSQ
ncbi:MAG: SBBP repeat-containing protein [Acidobacteria bacterium]|nr:SBBP repeat-containing protein [Acidobacteriota bacterium]MCI0718026.1 SBBP repeat-containing protein [Acidobacteriota bacterium]